MYKVSHIATVSRDLLCHRFAQSRLERAKKLADAQADLARARRMTMGSMFFFQDELRPLGVQWGVQAGQHDASGSSGDGYEADEADTTTNTANTTATTATTTIPTTTTTTATTTTATTTTTTNTTTTM